MLARERRCSDVAAVATRRHWVHMKTRRHKQNHKYTTYWQDVAQQLISAFILSLFDLCDSLLSCLPASIIQWVMNAAAPVHTMNLSLGDHVKPALKRLHWLPVQRRITYKLMNFIHIGQAPQYLSDCVSAASGRYRLRSTGSAVYVLPRT